MKKLIQVKNRPLDGRTPSMTISRVSYLNGLAKLRKQAKKEKKKLITNGGIEYYSEKF